MTSELSTTRTASPVPTLGGRLRQLRIARGLSQTDLAADRFSKEYVSQIERGKTRPTDETLEWLATRLGVDRTFLATGISSSERERLESAIARAEAVLESHDYAAVPPLLEAVVPELAVVSAPDLEFRALRTEAWARMYLGEVKEAMVLLERARAIAEGPEFTDVDRADILFRLGACRENVSSISTAIGLLSQALELADRSSLPCDRLRSLIFEWRSRCYQRQRDFEAAREDVERALELAESLNDPYAMAQAHFQASLVAERQGRWVLGRSHAERAKALYEEIAHRTNIGKLKNNLGLFEFLLGKPDAAIEHLKDAFRVALEVGSDVDAGYAVSSLAQVHLRTGNPELAEEQARKALEFLAGRADFIDGIGSTQLLLGRSLLDQGRLDEAEEAFALAAGSFDQFDSLSHRAAVWVAQGDLAARRGDDRKAAQLYRRAAEALQDFRL